MANDVYQIHKKLDKILKELSDDKEVVNLLGDIKTYLEKYNRSTNDRLMRIERELKTLKSKTK